MAGHRYSLHLYALNFKDHIPLDGDPALGNLYAVIEDALSADFSCHIFLFIRTHIDSGIRENMMAAFIDPAGMSRIQMGQEYMPDVLRIYIDFFS